MARYRKLSTEVEIEAFQFGVNFILDWFMDKVTTNEIILRKEGFCEIGTLAGVMVGNTNDYIIKGIKGEIYPCKQDIFEATYEYVGE